MASLFSALTPNFIFFLKDFFSLKHRFRVFTVSSGLKLMEALNTLKFVGRKRRKRKTSAQYYKTFYGRNYVAIGITQSKS
jgi:hypothetical protein